MKYKLFCDMDGCISDFEQAFRNIAKMSPEEYQDQFGEEEFWKLIEKEGVDFWEFMPWTDQGKELWDYIKKYNPTILTAPSQHPDCPIGKRKWVERELGKDISLIIDGDKHKYATPDSILIDDSKKKIKKWKKAGGIGIQHNCKKNTLMQLKQFMKTSFKEMYYK